MSSSGKKKTTMAKLARESRLRERRMLKQAKKDLRRAEPTEEQDTDSSTEPVSAAEHETADTSAAPPVT
jgi:hypothetical protein